MYTILVTDNNELVCSIKETIMQRSKLVDSLHFLVPQTYKSFEMKDFTCVLEYKLPISKKYKTEILTMSEDLYKEYIEFVLPFDTGLTSEHGNVEIQLTFTNVELDENGNGKQYVRKTCTTTIPIIPISAWSDIIPDEALNSVDQAFIKINTMIKSLEDVSEVLNQTKADNIDINDDGDVQLKSNGDFIGKAISLATVEISDTEDDDVDGIINITGKYSEITI